MTRHLGAFGPPLGFALLWAVLAALNPTTTYHLAPGLVAAAYVWARWQRARPSALVAVLGDAATGAVAATVITLLLAAAGVLRGAALIGGGPVGEALLLVAVTGVAASIVGARLAGGATDRSEASTRSEAPSDRTRT